MGVGAAGAGLQVVLAVFQPPVLVTVAVAVLGFVMIVGGLGYAVYAWWVDRPAKGALARKTVGSQTVASITVRKTPPPGSGLPELIDFDTTGKQELVKTAFRPRRVVFFPKSAMRERWPDARRREQQVLGPHLPAIVRRSRFRRPILVVKDFGDGGFVVDPVIADERVIVEVYWESDPRPPDPNAKPQQHSTVTPATLDVGITHGGVPPRPPPGVALSAAVYKRESLPTWKNRAHGESDGQVRCEIFTTEQDYQELRECAVKAPDGQRARAAPAPTGPQSFYSFTFPSEFSSAPGLPLPDGRYLVEWSAKGGALVQLHHFDVEGGVLV